MRAPLTVALVQTIGPATALRQQISTFTRYFRQSACGLSRHFAMRLRHILQRTSDEDVVRTAKPRLPATSKSRRAPHKPAAGKRTPNSVGRPKAGSVTIEAQDAIANAALPLFASMSFAAVSTKDIAAAAGLNTALIYYYFGSKDELFRRTVLIAANDAGQRFRALDPASCGAGQFVSDWLSCHEAEFAIVARLLRISMGYAAIPDRHQNVDDAIAGFHSDTRQMLRDALARGVADKTFASIEVDLTVSFVATFLDGVYLRAIIFPDYDPKPEIDELRTFLDSRLRATEG